MAQELDPGHKFLPLILDHLALDGASVSSHTGAQSESEKGVSMAFELALPNRSQDDYPDGGLQAWLVVFGVRLRDI